MAAAWTPGAALSEEMQHIATDYRQHEESESSTPEGQESEKYEDARVMEANMAEIVRTISERSRLGDQRIPGDLNLDDPRFDPHSEAFDMQAFVRTVLGIRSRDPETFPLKTAGVSFSNLSAYGYGTSTDHQKTVGNKWIDFFGDVYNLLPSQKRKRNRIDILRSFDGLVRSGETLVVLGRPGSGCSTLLKTIAGDTHGFHLSSDSNLQYQGISAELMNTQFRGELMYNAEVETHFPHLTVGDTLYFAALARAPRNRIAGLTREKYALLMRDLTMAMYGLLHTMNTKVGDDFVRGVSGGQRKRVSIAECTLAGSPIQCWDNSTRGLDSATALEFVKSVSMGTKYTGAAAVVAVYQASQSIYDIFDKVTVLYEGRQIYFGPASQARQFFIDMGYDCPERQTTGDFLTSLTNPSERTVREGFEKLVPRTPDEFVARWRASDAYAQLKSEIAAYEAEFELNGEALAKFRETRHKEKARGMSKKSPYTISYAMQVRLCIWRGFKRVKGDASVPISGIFGNIVMSLIISSMFFNMQPYTSTFFSRGALLFYAVLLNAFASSLEMLTLYAQRPIVEKHTKYAFYHPSAEAIASMIVDLPTKLIVSLSFNPILYFMTNLKRTPGAFFTFYLFSIVCTLVMSNVFRTIAACSRTLAQALAPAALFMLALIIYTGFTIPVRDMRVYFRWINYINPIGYAFESLMVNEFWGRDFKCSAFVPSGPGYADVDPIHRICSSTGAVAGQDTVSGSDFVRISYKYVKSHEWRNLGIMIGFFFFFLATYLIATEYISSQRSRGEVLVFRKGYKAHKSDIESNETDDATLVRTHTTNLADANERLDVIQRQTKTFHWQDVCYDIKIKGEPRRLLDHVDGWVKPGTLTALMGVSGAGKTTLLDVLATRTTMGVISGDFMVNGHQRDQSFQRKTGYVQQQDLHLETTTVREALTFSALVRQPKNVPDAEKIAYVSSVIELLEMEAYADAVVGVPGEGLNVEQRKRLTIGVELVAKPGLLLFFDEPTSGLDSQTAWSICRLMRKLANNGQAILCTIHQPSAVLMQEFDRLLFLAAGGRTVYFGPIGNNCSEFIKYFEENGASPCPPQANPAEWMLEVIGAAPGHKADRDWHEVWKASKDRCEVRNALATMKQELAQIPDNDSDPYAHDEFAQSLWTQFRLCFIRIWQQYWRTPSYIYSKVALSLLSSLFIGFSTFMAGNSLQGLQNQMFAAFMLLTLFNNLVQQMLPMFVSQRKLYEARERPSKAYSWKAFMMANMIVEFPWALLLAVIAFVSWYYPIGFYRNAQETGSMNERAGLMFLIMVAFFMFTSTFGHMVIAGVEVAETAGNISTLLFSLTLLFCGVLATKESMPGFWIFMYRVSPFTYIVSTILSTGVGRATLHCSDIEVSKFSPPAGQTCGEYLKAFANLAHGTILNPQATDMCRYCSMSSTDQYLAEIDIEYKNRWWHWALIWVYILFNIAAAVFIYYLARVPKKTGAKVAKTQPADADASKEKAQQK